MRSMSESLANHWPLMAAGLIAAFGVTVMLLRRPDSGLWMFAFLLYSNAGPVAIHFHGVPGPLAHAMIGLPMLAAAYHLFARRERLCLGPAPFALLGFFGAQFLSVLFSAFRDVALRELTTNIAEGLALYLLMVNAVRSVESLRQVTWAMLAAGAMLGGLGLFQAATHTQHLSYGGFAQVPDRDVAEEDEEWVAVPKPRAAGPIGEKNYYAQFMLMLTPLAFLQSRTERNWLYKGLAMAALLLILGGIGLSGSRGAAVGLAALLVVMAAFRYVTWAQLAVLGLAGAMVVVASPTYRERMSTFTTLIDIAAGGSSIQNADKAVQGRLTEMAAALLIFRDSPVVGIGPGNFPLEFVDRADSLGFQVHSSERYAHCMYLEIAAETGLLGLASFLALFGQTLWSLSRVRRHAVDPALRNMATALFLALVVLATTGVFLSFAYARYYWLLLALSAAVTALSDTARVRATEMNDAELAPSGIPLAAPSLAMPPLDSPLSPRLGTAPCPPCEC
jgi:O-antigen ligase